MAMALRNKVAVSNPHICGKLTYQKKKRKKEEDEEEELKEEMSF